MWEDYRWGEDVHKALRTVIGDGLKKELEAPGQLPTAIALLVQQLSFEKNTQISRPALGASVSEC
jgi:hypothetical protein